MVIERPKTLAAALTALAQESCAALAGGTNIMVDIKKERFDQQHLVALDDLDMLRGISEDADAIHIGSCTTFDEIEYSALLNAYPSMLALIEAAASVGGPQIRNRGTVGGNILCASPASDTVPALLVLDADLSLQTLAGASRTALDGFVTGVRKTKLESGELLMTIDLPKKNGRSCFYKVGTRNAMAISIVSCALYLEEIDGVVKNVRIAFGSVAPTAVRTYKTEQFLEGKPAEEILSPSCLTAVKEMIAGEIAPIGDLRATREYRMLVAGNVLEANLKRLLGKEGR